MRASIPIQRRDRPWVYAPGAYLIGPLPMPPVDEVRAAVARLVEAYPHSRLDWRFDADRRRWIPGASPEDIVFDGTWDESRPAEELVDAWLDDPSTSFPLAVIRFPNYLMVAVCHGIGDGRSVTAIIEGIAHAAISGQTGEWPCRPSGRYPLLAAAVRTFGRHPSMVRDTLRDRYPLDNPAPSGVQVPWKPSRRSIRTSIPRESVDEMVARAKELDVKVSRFALVTSVVLRALNAADFAVARDVTVMMDLRRYLGPGDWIDGNFAAAVPMRIGPETPPHELAAMVRATMRSGRPLANQILTSMRAGGRRRAPKTPATWADPHAPVRVTMSDLGDLPRSEAYEFMEGRPVLCVATAEPDVPQGLTFGIVRTRTSTEITVVFHRGVIDEARLQLALNAMATDAVGLLFAPRGAR